MLRFRTAAQAPGKAPGSVPKCSYSSGLLRLMVKDTDSRASHLKVLVWEVLGGTLKSVF